MIDDFLHFSRDAYVTATAMYGGTATFAFGDGAIVLLPLPYDEPGVYNASNGIIHTISPHGDGFLFGDEQGHLKTIAVDGTITPIHQFHHTWVEHIVLSQRLALSAIVAGKTLAIWDGKQLRQFTDHPSTVSGVAFAAKGNRIAAAHYNGITIWTPSSDKPITKHVWKGSHISITWSPDMKYIVTGTQEMDLHVFNLPNNNHLYMSGYGAKVKSLSWNAKGHTLFTSGSTQVLGWNFSGKGPAGKKPLSLGPDMAALVTQVCCHPKLKIVAAGYDNGRVLLINTENGEYVPVFRKDGDTVTSCGWDARGDYLVYGTKQGSYGIVNVCNVNNISI